ncbi:MAG: hydrolase, partial [Gammaproteobacteria bacterium]|nr:hydrolase [Gammaproteobacteria bacterium]
MRVQFLGHASFIVETMGKTIMFDPFITGNPKMEDKNIDQYKPDWI